MLIDTHCHLHDREFFSEKQAEEFLENARKNEVSQVVCIGTDPSDSLAAKEFAKNHKNVFWTWGIHPENAENYIINLKKDKNLVAIGEVGLDYHYEQKNRTAQIRLFEEMLQLAKDVGLPVSFHVREAFDDFFAVVANFPEVRGVVHSFTDNKKNLKKALERDFFVGVNGLATYSTLSLPPLEKIILETDAPFLTPTPNRGKINQPAYVKDIAIWLANKTGLSLEEITEKTTENARKLFNIPNPGQ